MVALEPSMQCKKNIVDGFGVALQMEAFKESGNLRKLAKIKCNWW